MKCAFSLLLCCALLTACRHVRQDRFFVDAHINDKPVLLAYDTGSECSLVFKKTMKRVGLKGEGPGRGKPAPGKVMIGQTDFCKFKLDTNEYRLRLASLKLPWWWNLDVDGVIGWPDVMDDVLSIDASTATMKGLEKLPEETSSWAKAPLYTHTGVLALQIPRADGKPGVVEVDTGNSAGVSLSPTRWTEWKTTHPHAHWSWTLDLMPGSGAILGRKYTADEVTIGPVVLTNVPIRKANRTEMGIAGEDGIFEGSIGFQALERMNLIVDQKNEVAYLQSKPALLVTNEARHRNPPSHEPIAFTNSTVHVRFKRHELLDEALEGIHSGKPNEAIAGCMSYLEVDPTNAWIMACCGEARYKLAASEGNATNVERALGELNRALKLNPGIVPGYYVRGGANYLAHQWNDAVKDYRHFCQVDQRFGTYPRFFIWMIRSQNGEKAAADEELGAYFKKGRKDISAWEAEIGDFLLGRMNEDEFLRAGKVSDAKQRGGRQCEAWFYAGIKRQLAGDRTVARDYMQKCVATGSKPAYEYGFAVAELKALE